jgi:hypothetical protein
MLGSISRIDRTRKLVNAALIFHCRSHMLFSKGHSTDSSIPGHDLAWASEICNYWTIGIT